MSQRLVVVIHNKDRLLTLIIKQGQIEYRLT